MKESKEAPKNATNNTAPTNEPKVADPNDVAKNKTMAILAYFIFFLPLITDAKDSQFAKFHANQGLLLVIASFAMMAIDIVLAFIPIVGWFASIGLHIAIFVFWIMGLVNASNGQMKELPVIGSIHLIDK